ncbi:leucine-rich repeat flightless-interacting protein 1 isoform X6 [Cyrtonyx montezumae]|uniref:leucine-rich repeat flightless-interacting protein 1 isoform X6 n=1 Tax=Cyrtonyx montezumae TaxID=9017 RepID=UPI0032DA30FD
MGTQGACRKRLPNRERLTAEDDALNQIAREAEARLAAKRAARAEAREIRMKELERQQKEIYQVQKKYYGLDTKWGDIEQWMEDSERYSRRARRNASASDEDERMSVGSRGSLRSHLDYASTYPVAGLENERTKWKNYSKATNGYEEDVYGSSQSRKSSRASYYPDLGLHNSGFASTSQPSSHNGNWASVYDESVCSGSRRYSASSSRAPSEYSCYLSSGSRASSRASSARASPVIEERPEKDFEKGARTVSSLSAATLASLGGTSSRRGSVETSISADTETSIREIKDIYELKEQIQDVEGKYMQGLKEMKDSLAEVEEKYKKAMVSNAQLDNEKTNFMYQVDTLKDALLELEEQLAESRRQYEEKSKEFEREKHAHSILQFQFKEIKEALKQREEMLAKHGIIPDSDIATNGEASDALDSEGHLDSSKAVQGTTQALKTAGDGMLGRAKEVDMKNEILEDVGKGEMLQNSEREEHKEESEEQEAQTLRADENTEAEKMMEETDAVSTVTFPGSRFAEHTQSLTRPTAGNASSNDESDAGGLREEAESAGTAAQQPASREAERRDLAPGTTEKSEAGSLQGGDFDSPQETRTDLGTERELQAAAPEQEGEDEEPSHALSANGAGEAAGSASGSCEMGSGQSGLPQPELAGSLGEEVNGEGHTKMLQGSEGSAASEVPEVLEKGFVESRDCADGTGGDRAEEQNEVGSTDQGLEMERDSVGSEGEEWYESGAPSDTKEEGGGEEDLQEEVLTGNSEACSDAAEKQEKSSGECVGSVSRGGGSALQQTELDVDTVKATASQETSLDTDFSDDETEETEMQTGFASGEGKENSTGHLEQNRAGELEPKTELQALQCSEETTGDAVEEKSISAGGEAQSIVKQEEGESKEESVVYHSAASENQGDKEAFKETQLEPADRQGDGFTCEEDRTGSLARKAELDENVSEQLGPEGQAEEELEDDGDAFDFDDDSEQIEEADEKGDGEEVDAQCEEDGRANSAISNSAPAGGAGERTGETETSNTLTEGDSLQSEEGDGSEETGCLQEEAASVKSDGKAEVLEGENKASDSNEGEDVLGQDLGSAGSSRAESREDLRGGRKGKGKSRDDCTIS